MNGWERINWLFLYIISWLRGDSKAIRFIEMVLDTERFERAFLAFANKAVKANPFMKADLQKLRDQFERRKRDGVLDGIR